MQGVFKIISSFFRSTTLNFHQSYPVSHNRRDAIGVKNKFIIVKLF